MNIDLTTIINAIIALLAAVVTYRVIPWIKAKTTNEQQAYIRALVKAGVFAAEQIYNTDGMGHQKMEYVKKWLNEQGLDINVTEIEAAVSEYINHPPEGVLEGVLYAEEQPVETPEGEA